MTQTDLGSYAYDLRGNQVARPGYTMTHNAHNKVATLTNTRTNALAARYVYDADGTRVWQEDGEGVRTMVGGLYERHARTDGSVDHTWTIQAPEAVAIKVQKKVSGGNTTTKTLYPILDRLGSPIVTVDEAGAVVQSQLFDAWGKLEGAEGGEAERPKVNLGYTGHTAEDVYGIIDMGGRQYDPALGRFLQPDIVIQAPENMQSFNRYTYVFNNPFRYIDPSGYVSVTNADKLQKRAKNGPSPKELAVKALEFATPVGSVNDANRAFDQAWAATCPIG